MPEKFDRETKKEIAKIGMTAALGLTVVTAPFLKKNRLMKNLHTAGGVTLVALSLWHHLLYQPEKRKAKSEAPTGQLDDARQAIEIKATNELPA